MEDTVTTEIETINLSLNLIRLDGGTQARASIDETNVVELIADYNVGEPIPPIKVAYDGEAYWLYDGFHRVAARLRAGFTDIPARVRPGTQRDAVLWSKKQNRKHGLKRTAADLHRAIDSMLLDEEWGKRSYRWIAEQCGTSHAVVGRRAARLKQGGQLQAQTSRLGRDGKTYSVPRVDPWQVGARFEAETSEARATVRALAGAPLARGTWEVSEANEAHVVVVEVGKSGKPKASTSTQLLRELADRLSETLTFTQPAPASPFPDGCTSAKARIAHAKTLSTIAAIDKLLGVEGLQTSARSDITNHRCQLERIERYADRAAVFADWHILSGDGGLLDALIVRMEQLASETAPLTPIASNAQLLDEVAELDTEEAAGQAMFQIKLPRAVRRAALMVWRRLRTTDQYWNKAQDDDTPGVKRAFQRAADERAALAKRREEVEHYAETMSKQPASAAMDFVAAGTEPDKLRRWLETESRKSFGKFGSAGRDELRLALGKRLIELGVKLEECPACPACWAEQFCMHCHETPERVRQRLAQEADAGHQLGKLLACMTEADSLKIQRRLLADNARFDVTAWLLAEEYDDVREFLGEATVDDLDELRELLVVGEMAQADLVVMAEIQQRHAALLAPAVAPSPPVQEEVEDQAEAAEPAPEPVPEPRLVTAEGSAVEWSAAEGITDASVQSTNQLLGYLRRVAGAAMPPAGLRDPTLLALINKWSVAGGLCPQLIERDEVTS